MEILTTLKDIVALEKTSATSTAGDETRPRQYNAANLSCFYRNAVERTPLHKTEWTADTQKAGKAIARWMETRGEKSKRWLLLAGNMGTGKSVFLRAICSVIGTNMNAATGFGWATPEVWTALRLSKESSEEREKLANRAVMVIDDIGTEPRTMKDYGTETAPFAELVLQAYERAQTSDLPILIMATNLNASELSQRYGDRVIDRLREMCEFVTFTGESFRK